MSFFSLIVLLDEQWWAIVPQRRLEELGTVISKSGGTQAVEEPVIPECRRQIPSPFSALSTMLRRGQDTMVQVLIDVHKLF